MRDPLKPIDPIYVQEEEDGSLLFGVGPEDGALINEGYACSNCLEVFRAGETLIQLPRCPTCGMETMPRMRALPEDWRLYIAEKEHVLSTPAGPDSATPRLR